MLLVVAALLIVLAIALPLWIRPSALPAPEPPSPTRHLEEKKAIIYENLRDLQAEYHMGKLSDQDYQQTKLDLQKELAAVLQEIEKVSSSAQPLSAAEPGETSAAGTA